MSNFVGKTKTEVGRKVKIMTTFTERERERE